MNTRKYLLNVSIGPVQEFIAEARKTRDLWVGSYLLASMTFKALEPFIKHSEVGIESIIYPSLKVSQEKLQVASLPNHFLVIVPEDKLEEMIEQSKRQIENYWMEGIVRKSKDELKKKLDGISDGWDALWKVQVCDLWQYMWVAIPVTDDDLSTGYQGKAREIQRMLEQRKLTRTFAQWTGNTAIKCTQCGHREVLGPEELSKSRDFWHKARGVSHGRFRKGDRLCAVCTIKRFVKASDIQEGLGEIKFESTRDIASIPFKKLLNEKTNEKEKERLINAVNGLAGILPLKKEVTTIGDISGDLLYIDSIPARKMIKEYSLEIKTEKIEPYVSELTETLKELSKKLKAKPSPYYAILFMDGDGIGKWMSGELPGDRELTREIHTQMSESLAKLATEITPSKLKPYFCKTIYSGGDDTLILGPVDDILDVALQLRMAFSNNGLGKRATSSAGVVIAHCSDSFKRALEDGRRAVEEAKGMFNNKDAFCVILRLSSGGVFSGGYKWYVPEEGGGFSVIEDVLKRLVGWLIAKELSPRFIYNMLNNHEIFYEQREKKVEFHAEMFKAETKRLFERHASSISLKEEIESIVDKMAIIASPDVSKRFDPIENFRSLLKIAAFIFRETICQ